MGRIQIETMERYEIGVYTQNVKDEKIISEFIADETVFEITDKEDILICDKRAVLITKDGYEQLPVKYNLEIPAGKPAMDEYEIPNTLIVVVDATEKE